MTKIAINGFGRIGRIFFRLACQQSDLDVIAINDLGDLDNFVYLLKHDSVYRQWDKEIKAEDGNLVVNNKKIKFFQEKDPIKLPWKELEIDVVVEATGFFESFEKAQVHLEAGAKRVVISAPTKDQDGQLGKTVLMGINEDDLKDVKISSNGSCTTNSIHPVIQILNETIGVKKALLTTIHSYTATQKIVDGPDSSDWRRGRAGAQNIVPSTTGAATALSRVIPDLKGLFDGIAVRVPTIAGSLSDITFVAKRKTTVEEINNILMTAEKEVHWQGIFKTSQEELVSSDIIGDPYASIIDLKFTRVVDGDLVKVLAWYDNEMGYVHTLVRHVIEAGVALETRN